MASKLTRPKRDEVREERISMEIIVDAYDPEEQALGWYYHLEEKLAFPFKAKCIEERRISPLKKGETVEVSGMAPERDCTKEMFVMVEWSGRSFGVPLSQLKAIKVDEDTQQALDDWNYWVGQGHMF